MLNTHIFLLKKEKEEEEEDGGGGGEGPPQRVILTDLDSLPETLRKVIPD